MGGKRKGKIARSPSSTCVISSLEREAAEKQIAMGVQLGKGRRSVIGMGRNLRRAQKRLELNVATLYYHAESISYKENISRLKITIPPAVIFDCEKALLLFVRHFPLTTGNGGKWHTLDDPLDSLCA